jgi:hypothetical protein
MMLPEAREKLISSLVSIVRTPMDERVRRDRLAQKCLLFHIFTDDATIGTEESIWERDIWSEVMKQIGIGSWAEVMGDVKMPGMRKH